MDEAELLDELLAELELLDELPELLDELELLDDALPELLEDELPELLDDALAALVDELALVDEPLVEEPTLDAPALLDEPAPPAPEEVLDEPLPLDDELGVLDEGVDADEWELEPPAAAPVGPLPPHATASESPAPSATSPARTCDDPRARFVRCTNTSEVPDAHESNASGGA